MQSITDNQPGRRGRFGKSGRDCSKGLPPPPEESARQTLAKVRNFGHAASGVSVATFSLSEHPVMSAQPTETSAINTKAVENRRPVQFRTLDEILDDAHALAAAGWVPLGNWSLGQVCFHIARTLDMSIDGVDYKAPWYIRAVVKLLKRKMLSKTFPPGFKPPREISSRLETQQEISDEQGLAILEKAIRRFQTDKTRRPSPVFGNLTEDEWLQLHTHHAELHFGFLKPKS